MSASRDIAGPTWENGARKNPRDDGESSGGMADWIGVDKMSVPSRDTSRNPAGGVR